MSQSRKVYKVKCSIELKPLDIGAVVEVVLNTMMDLENHIDTPMPCIPQDPQTKHCKESSQTQSQLKILMLMQLLFGCLPVVLSSGIDWGFSCLLGVLRMIEVVGVGNVIFIVVILFACVASLNICIYIYIWNIKLGMGFACYMM